MSYLNDVGLGCHYVGHFNQTLLALSPRLHVRHGEAVKDTGDLTKKISSEGRVFRIEILAKEVGSSSFGIAFTLTNRCFKDKNLKMHNPLLPVIH